MLQSLRSSKISYWAQSILEDETYLLAFTWHNIITMYTCRMHDASLLTTIDRQWHYYLVATSTCDLEFLGCGGSDCPTKIKENSLYYSTTNLPPSLPASKDKNESNWVEFIIAQGETPKIPCWSLVNRPFTSCLCFKTSPSANLSWENEFNLHENGK